MPWYYYKNGRRAGPIDDAVFRRMAADGQLEPTDFVWSPGMKEWAQAATIPGLLQPPPIPVLSQVESEPFAFGISSALPASAATSTPTATPMVPHTQSKSDQPEPSKPSPTRETGSPQQVRERQPRAAIPSSKGGKCPRCAFLLPESAFLLEDYRCPACGTTVATALEGAAQNPVGDKKDPSPAIPVATPAEEDTLPQAPHKAYGLAVLSGFLGLMLWAALALLSLKPRSPGWDLFVLFTALPTLYILLGWFFGRKYPAVGWRWMFWLGGPTFLLGVLSKGSEIRTQGGVPENLAGLVGHVLGLFLFLLLPPGLGGMLGSRKTRSKH